MKTQFKILFSAVTFLLAGSIAASGFQSDPAEEVPGDNFSLEGALELFKKSASPQEFEQLLNSPDSKVNNLDLNGDGDIDYIRVLDKNNGNVHAFIIQSVISANESQDIAVIELEKRKDGSAVLQIVGDADIYGIETIIEPTEEVRVNAGASTARTVVNVWSWPSVQYVYGPYYDPWVSPYYWGYYPRWYRPWRPIAWHVYDPYWASYRPYYSICHRHRIVYAPVIYRPYRTTSVIVTNRHYTQINTFRNASHGYRHDRSNNPARYSSNDRNRSSYGSGNRRSDYTTNRRSDYNSTGRTRGDSGSEYRSNGRTSGSSNRSNNSNHSNSSGNDRRQRSFTPPAQRGNSGGSERRSTSTPPQRSSSENSGRQRSYSPPPRQSSSPQRSVGSPQRQSSPARQSTPQRSGGSGGGSGNGRRH